MRRLFLRLEVLVVVIVAGSLAVLAASSGAPARPDLELTAGPGDTLTLSNSKEGSAILSLGGMRPGDSVTDTVTLGNTGTIPGDLTLSTSNLLDAPGAGGGVLSGELDLRIRDITNAGSPVTVYSGKIGAVAPVALGSLAAGDSRVYEFRVNFPDAGPGAENAHQGSSMSIQFDWTAFNPDSGDTTPPETTMTSAPPALSASADATFAFSSNEPGSTFECSLDGGAYAPCTTPATSTGLADGAHSFDVRATDAAANTDTTPAGHAWTIDTTAPNVSLADPGAYLRGTVTLSASAGDGSGSGVATLVIQRSPAGTGNWTNIGANWDTTGVSDGEYDLRARATDAAGNSANSAVHRITVDNTAPSKPTKFRGSNKNGRLVLTWQASDNTAVGACFVYVNGARVKTLSAYARSASLGSFRTSDRRSFQVAVRDKAANVGPKSAALVVIPRLRNLTVADAGTRLTARGLKAGSVTYAYSSSIARGRVIRGARSGVAAKGATVGLRVSRGTKPTAPSSNGPTPPRSYGTPNPPPSSGFTPTDDGSPTATLAPTSPPASTPSPEAEGPPAQGTIEPESFSPADDDASTLRRLLGLGLLGGAFLAAGGVAFRARGPRMPSAREQALVEPLMFWDQRLARTVVNSIRRLLGRG